MSSVDVWVEISSQLHFFSQCAHVILTPRWTLAAPRQVSAAASLITAVHHVISVLLVTMGTQAAHVSIRGLAGCSVVELDQFFECVICVLCSLRVFCWGFTLQPLWSSERSVCLSSRCSRPQVWCLHTRIVWLSKLSRYWCPHFWPSLTKHADMSKEEPTGQSSRRLNSGILGSVTRCFLCVFFF